MPESQGAEWKQLIDGMVHGGKYGNSTLHKTPRAEHWLHNGDWFLLCRTTWRPSMHHRCDGNSPARVTVDRMHVMEGDAAHRRSSTCNGRIQRYGSSQICNGEDGQSSDVTKCVTWTPPIMWTPPIRHLGTYLLRCSA